MLPHRGSSDAGTKINNRMRRWNEIKHVYVGVCVCVCVCDVSSLMWKFSSSVLCLEMKQLHEESSRLQPSTAMSVFLCERRMAKWCGGLVSLWKFTRVLPYPLLTHQHALAHDGGQRQTRTQSRLFVPVARTHRKSITTNLTAYQPGLIHRQRVSHLHNNVVFPVSSFFSFFRRNNQALLGNELHVQGP